MAMSRILRHALGALIAGTAVVLAPVAKAETVTVGLVGAVFLLGKVLRVGLRSRVRGIPSLVRWHRWVSWSLLALYGAIFVSGVLVLLPIHGRLYGNLLELHLMTSVWAVPPTTWHVWHYRRLAAPC